ncbi:MAG: hypothetical protein ABI559_09070 [Chloroflexota bacterium]
MLRSEKRILTTHAGSLLRPPKLLDLLVAQSNREVYDEKALAAEIHDATVDVIRHQRAAGIDIGNNGEEARESFFTYVQHRLSGFGGQSNRAFMSDVFIEGFMERKLPEFQRKSVNLMQAAKAIGDVRHVAIEPLREECDGFDQAMSEAGRFEEPFMTAASPGIVCAGMLNDHYASDDEYVTAVADALRPEYEYIISRGYTLQLDCPDLAMERHVVFANRPLAEFQAYVKRNIAAINRAIEGLPREKIRMHVCWGNYEGPHHHDVPLEDVLPLFYEANVGALLLPFANPRHQHEWRALEKYPPPHNWLIIAGVIDTTTNYIEHPQVVSDRIEAVAMAVGDPHRVLAATDCGFGTAAGFGECAPGVVWEKLRSLREGADIASAAMFG